MTLGTMLLWMLMLMYGVPIVLDAYLYPDVAWMIVGPICWWTLILVAVVIVCLWLARIESQPERSSS